MFGLGEAKGENVEKPSVLAGFFEAVKGARAFQEYKQLAGEVALG